MRMEIAHTGRTGKETTITFDTDRMMFCYGREPHDVFIYAEQTRDVVGVINDLKKIGYAEVTIEEFRKQKHDFMRHIEMIEQEALNYERGKMLRDDSEVEIAEFEGDIWLYDYSETRGGSEGIKKLCKADEVDPNDIEEMCGKHNWYIVGI